ncbi:MAG TPA: hypothetical protein VJ719_00145 [Chthoniobacterales bacterium]|nr:hypothetical protein [Chthoniobacterales bacterium]
MKSFLLITLSWSAVFLTGCETTETAGGNQEAKRRAAIEQRRQQVPPDEAQANLWNAQQDRLNRDGNPSREF